MKIKIMNGWHVNNFNEFLLIGKQVKSQEIINIKSNILMIVVFYDHSIKRYFFDTSINNYAYCDKLSDKLQVSFWNEHCKIKEYKIK
ncbi:MAG: hypothetical protein ABIP51_19190 [Bacteroidia bacterium]